ncbi:hypothetical protein QX249_09050 [Vibrio parahaemolyticus]|uniref:Uncharacterized protein n=1 Tax=Vibrio parahaemolyticus TaxID=670 RepID=A0AAW8Q0J3_VIBPH|nr:hypothetical protein [Vibrio parahaemolyticus]EGR2229402.1 hypothetical protein [Vibrio parahaemolyticus]MDS1820800.1 hypothetical protein [Vibrio parahaemolyticus]
MNNRFSITCAVTNTPISGGQPIRILFGVKKTIKGLRQRSEDTFQPFGYFLKGFYSPKEDGTVNLIKVGNYSAKTSGRKVITLSEEAYTDEQRFLRALCEHHAKMTNGRKGQYSVTFDELLNELNQEYEYVTVPSTENTGEISFLAVHEHVYSDISKEIMWRLPKTHIYKLTTTQNAISNLTKILKSADSTERQEKLKRKMSLFAERKEASDDNFSNKKCRAEFDRLHGSRFLLQTLQEETNYSEIVGLKDILANKFEVDDVVFDVMGTLSFLQFMNRYNLPLLPSKRTISANDTELSNLYKQLTKWTEGIPLSQNED